MTQQIIGERYQLVREVARGGICTIFEAMHKVLQRQVAIKMLSAPRKHDTIAKERLILEARVLTRAQDAGVVAAFDAGITGEGDPYLVMELLRGRTLSGMLAARRKLRTAEVLHLAKQLADTLAVVHRRGIVHRDLKPANVFLAQDGGPQYQVKLFDFGIATIEHQGYQLTRDGELLGTPQYMAPEQLMTERTDARSDVYSLGVTLYECLTGEVPFKGNFGEVLLQATSQPLPAISERVPDVPASLAQLIERALSVKPKDRFADGEEFAKALCDVDDAGAAEFEHAGRATLPAGAAEPMAAQQRRRHTRAAYITPVRVVLADGSAKDGRSEDISEGGILVLLEGPPRVGDAVSVRFALPISGHIVSVDGTVRWIVDARRPAAVGLEFKELSGEAGDGIRKYVSLMRQP